MIFIFLTSTTFALLPPLAQSTRELRALLDDNRFYSSLGSAEQIQEIIRNETGYLIVTQNYSMQVDIKYGGRDHRIIGPARFEFTFNPPIELN